MTGERVLVVEDDAILAEHLADTLTGYGYRVDPPLASGEDAVSQVQLNPPDIILMDIKLLGEMTGIGAAQQIVKTRDIPVIYMTAYSDPELLRQAIGTEPYGYLVKPVQSNDVRTTIEVALTKHRLDRKVKASERKYRTLAEAIPDPVFIIDRDDTILYVNTHAAQALKHSPEQILGKPRKDLFLPDIADDQGHNLQTVFTTGKPLRKDVRILSGDHESWQDNSFVPLKDETENVTAVLGISRDITERKRMEEKLREIAEALKSRQQEYVNLIQLNTEAILILDSEYLIRFVNPAAENLFGRSSTELSGMPLGYAIPTGELSEIEIPRKDGTVWFGEIHAFSDIFWEDKPAIMTIIRDITERRKMEQAIRDSEKSFRGLFNTVGEAIYVMDVDGTFLEVNKGAMDIYGQLGDFFLGQSIDVLYAPGTFDMGQTINLLERAFNGEPQKFEITGCRANGEMFPAECRLYRGYYFGKDVIIGLLIDITKRKQAEDALRKVNTQLNLLSSITRHDILNQLMALKGYLELSHEEINNPATLIKYIKQEEKAANTIEAQITFTKNYQSLGITAPVWQNVNENIKKAVTGLPMRAVRVEIDPNDPEIFADQLFEKVFYNLIDNALRYGGADMKTIRFTSAESTTGLTILCEDDGVGITAEDKKKLFTRGFGKHTGLGLFLSREILAITGITITENGVPGNGARFEITVPKGAWRMKGAST